MPIPLRPTCYSHVVGLRAVRHFQTRTIPAEEIDAILEAARWTGSARNRQAWAFVVISDPEDIARLAEAGGANGPLTRAVLAIGLVRLPGGNDFDLGRAAQNIMLAAAARGIGSCPVTLHNQERATAILGLPENHFAQRAIALGYPDYELEAASRAERRTAGGSGRKPLEVVVHRGAFRP